MPRLIFALTALAVVLGRRAVRLAVIRRLIFVIGVLVMVMRLLAIAGGIAVLPRVGLATLVRRISVVCAVNILGVIALLVGVGVAAVLRSLLVMLRMLCLVGAPVRRVCAGIGLVRIRLTLAVGRERVALPDQSREFGQRVGRRS